jgi:hypothetical protein
MSRVIYDSNRLIPAPLVSISKQYTRAADGTKLGSNFSIVLQGKCIPHMGSPNESGAFWTAGGFPPNMSASGLTENNALGILLKKQEAIKTLFSNDHKLLEIQTEDSAYQATKCNPQILDISFSEGPWWQFFDYTITMSAPAIYINGSGLTEPNLSYVESASESWDIQPTEEYTDESSRTYTITHNVGAKGLKNYSETGVLIRDAWEEARVFVASRLGFNLGFNASGSIPEVNTGYTPYNFMRSQNVDKLGGSYSVTENWTLSKEAAVETFEISTETSSDSNLNTVSIQGTIQGLETRNPTTQAVTTTKYSSAEDKFDSLNILSRAQTYAGFSLNILPAQEVIGRNPNAGTISYQYRYDDRPSNIIPNSKSESITINESLQTEFPVPIFVLGRTRGPVIQNLETSKEKRRTLNIEAVVTTSGLVDINNNPRTLGYIDSIITAATPNGDVVLIEDRQETWDCITGRYSYTQSWLFD